MGISLKRLCRACLGALLALVFVPAHGAATLYKWVDENGVTHYSDRPAPGAQKVRIASAQTYSGGDGASASSRSPASRPGGRPAPAGDAAPVSYTHLEITTPADGAVLTNTGGRVELDATLEPALADGHTLWFVVDGKSYQAGAGGTLSVELARGQHTASASVTDAQGTEIVTSASVQFVVRQTSVAQPPTGPLVQKPKPHG